MHKLILASCLAFTACVTPGASSHQFYPLDELKALDQPDDRIELLAHALEVAPSQRNGEWRALVERASAAALREAEVNSSATAEQALDLAVAQSARFTFLKRSKEWLAARAEMGIKALNYVAQSSHNQFPARVLEFAKQDSMTPHLAQRLVEEVLLKHLIASTTTGLFNLAFEREHGAVCSTPSLVKVAVELTADNEDFRTGLKECWGQLEAPLIDAVKKSDTRVAKLRICGALKADHADAPSVRSTCTE